MNDDDRYITSFLFPTERTAFVPDTNSVNEEKRRLEKSLVSGAFQCPKCLKTFSRSSNLVRHQATVACDPDVTSQQASLQCEKCLKTFTKASNLKRHQAGAGCEPGVSLQCEKCLRTFTLASKLKRHQAGAGCEPGVSQQASLQCEKCLKTFTRADNMKRHGAGTCNGVSAARASFPCHLCSKTFATSRFLDRHIRNKHSNKCPHCGKCFDTKDNLAKHARKHLNEEYLTVQQARTLRKIAGKSATVSAAQRRSTCTGSVAGPSGCDHQSPVQNHPAFRQSIKRIHGNAGVVFTIKPSGAEKHSLLEMFSGKRSHFNWNLTEQLNRWTNTRWYMAVNARMLRFDSEGNIRDEERPTFRSQAQVLLTADDISSQIDLAFFKINSSLETFCSSASGWVLDEILTIEQTILVYRPLAGRCGDFVFPADLEYRGLVSVTGRPSNSTDCFIWAVVIALHVGPDRTDPYIHWTELQEERKSYRLTKSMSENSAVTMEQVSEFEILNRVSVNVYTIEKETVFPLLVSKYGGPTRGHSNLLLLHTDDADDDNNDPETEDRVFKHYCAITNLGKLIYRQRNGHHTLHVCPRCLQVKYSESDLNDHMELCKTVDPLRVKMPDPQNKYMRFRNYHRQLEAPFVIVARFESYRKPIYDRDEPTEGAVVRERVHEPCAFAYYVLSVDNSHPSQPVVFSDPDPEKVMMEFLRRMKGEQDRALAIMGAVRPMQYCDDGLRNIEASNDECHICDDPFLPGQKVVLDHDHVSGKIRGRACNSCNLNFKNPNHIVVLMHDLSAYDGRIIMSAAALHGASSISVIPKTIDTYTSITIDKSRYIDWQNFFKGFTLDSLIDDLPLEEGGDCFEHTLANWPSRTVPIQSPGRVPLCRDYIDGPERLVETCLPPIASFSDSTEGTDITTDQYQRGVAAWDSLDQKCLGEYLKLALVTDCLFMSDIVSKVRQKVKRQLRLDPLRYYSLASFAFDSALRFTQTTLELLTDVEMHLMVENAIRGGLAVVGTPRLTRANNPQMPRDLYDETAEESRIDFLDFNGLYTSTMMSSRLPTHGFRFLTETEIEQIDFMTVPEDADHGYILEVDLKYDADVHETHDDFPMAPEHTYVTKDDLSAYTRNTAASCNIDLENLSARKCLCLTLRDKSKYTLHYRNLQFYVRHGLRVTRVHRVLTFTQVPFLENFMKHCSEQRMSARAPLYRKMWKNISNLVAGKSYENPRNYTDVRICTSSESVKRYVSKTTFDCLRVFHENLTAVQLHRPIVMLSKPITVGFCVLELSKLAVYSFYYDFVKTDLAKGGKVAFLSGDTDSFVIKTTGVSDLDDRYKKAMHLFDFSNLPETHPLKSDHNRMVPGKLKFELPGHVCCEFVALSPKCYSMQTDKGFKQARKGCSRELRHELYKECLISGSCHQTNVKEIRHYGQKLYQVSVTKKVLNVLDTKRYHFNAVDSVSFGHCSLGNEHS